MKNTNIHPGQLVQEEIRLEVYKEALKQLDEPEIERYGLTRFLTCLRLPCILWELQDVDDYSPSGHYWYVGDTKKMFPEIKGIRHEARETVEAECYPIRKRYLESAIQTLEKK
jgi:hypothetical protein